MKRACLFLMLLAWAGAACPALLCAQISSSAFDPNCYQPRIGVPGEIDTIYGGHDGQGLGQYQFSPGPGPNSPYNRVFLSGYMNNPNGWDILTGGPGFNLHDLNPPKASFFPKYGGYIGHFHSPKLLDLYSQDRIYWADDNGNYDSSRFTGLGYHQRGPNNYEYRSFDFSPYIAHMTSDSVDDLVLCYTTDWYPAKGTDTQWVVHFTGGAEIFKPGDTVLNDDATFFSSLSDRETFNAGRAGVAGDFRGIGREDFIAAGGDSGGTLFYFHNDHPFSLARFTDAMRKDTFYTRWQNPEIPVPPGGAPYWILQASRVFPRAKSDLTMDLIGSFARKDDPGGNPSINFFRGGSNFGSKRILANDTTLCIRCPIYYDNTWDIAFGGGVQFCGDMTGTGNPVVVSGGEEPGYSHSFFYVLGEAADPLVDMYIGQYYGAVGGDTITADGDLLEDLIQGNSFYRTQGGGQAGVGTIQVIHGSKKIPVALNPLFANVTKAVQSGDSIQIAPNPCSTHTVVTWESSCSGAVELQLYDVMGRQVYQERRPTTGTLESFSLDLPKLPNGEYFLVLIQEPCVQHARIIIQE